MHLDNTLDTERLADLIGRKHDVLVQLCDVSRRQISVICDGDMSELLVMLSAKQTLLVQIQQIERRLDPFRSQDPESRHWPSGDQRQRVAGVAQRSEELLGEIMQIENQCERELSRRRDEAAHRLDGAADASLARTGYIQAAGPPESQLDLTSE